MLVISPRCLSKKIAAGLSLTKSERYMLKLVSAYVNKTELPTSIVIINGNPFLRKNPPKNNFQAEFTVLEQADLCDDEFSRRVCLYTGPCPDVERLAQIVLGDPPRSDWELGLSSSFLESCKKFTSKLIAAKSSLSLAD